MRSCIRHASQRGVKVLTVFAFSSENWKRPGDEVSYLMELLVGAVKREIAEFQRGGIVVRFVGERTGLSEVVKASIDSAEKQTAAGHGLHLNV